MPFAFFSIVSHSMYNVFTKCTLKLTSKSIQETYAGSHLHQGATCPKGHLMINERDISK